MAPPGRLPHAPPVRLLTDELLAELLSDTRAVVRELLAEPARTRDALAAELDAAAARFSAPPPRGDLPLGRALLARCQAWLARWDALGPDARRWVQVGVRYFAMEDDGEDDWSSLFGFDDDREVLDVVARALGEAPIAEPAEG